MLNQSFNYSNIREIYENERRKGFDLDKKFFPNTHQINKKLQKLRNEKNESPAKLKQYQEELNSREESIQKEIYDLCSDKKIENHKIEIIKSFCPRGKELYTIKDDDSIAYFYMKLVQNNIKKCYKVVQSDRFKITNQLSIILNDIIPKSILRIDIKSFYENINHDKVVKFINSNPILSSSTRKIISNILYQYKEYSSKKNGIPRGLGISAYLAELYMRSFDKEIRNSEDVIYYARYVDDIVIVFSGEVNEKDIVENIKELLYNLELEMHDVGKKYFFANSKEIGKSFSYLGYRFEISSNGILIDISNERMNKIKKRIELSLNDYNKKRKKYISLRGDNMLQRRLERPHEDLFIKRIKFLTNNAKLCNSKKHTVVGIFFSNRLITTYDSLKECDLFLSKILKKMSNRVIRKIKNHTFEEGFKTKRFIKLTAQELEEVTRVWKYVL